MAAAQHRVHIAARAITFMDLLLPVRRCPVQEVDVLRHGGWAAREPSRAWRSEKEMGVLVVPWAVELNLAWRAEGIVVSSAQAASCA